MESIPVSWNASTSRSLAPVQNPQASQCHNLPALYNDGPFPFTSDSNSSGIRHFMRVVKIDARVISTTQTGIAGCDDAQDSTSSIAFSSATLFGVGDAVRTNYRRNTQHERWSTIFIVPVKICEFVDPTTDPLASMLITNKAASRNNIHQPVQCGGKTSLRTHIKIRNRRVPSQSQARHLSLVGLAGFSRA